MPKKLVIQNASDIGLERIALRFRALSETSRLKIVQALHDHERNVTDLVQITGLSQPNVSRHLQILLSAGLIARKKEGQVSIYRIADQTLCEVCEVICRGLAAGPHEQLFTSNSNYKKS